MTNKPNTTSEYGRSKSMDKRLRAMGKPEPTPPVDAPPANPYEGAQCGHSGRFDSGHVHTHACVESTPAAPPAEVHNPYSHGDDPIVTVQDGVPYFAPRVVNQAAPAAPPQDVRPSKLDELNRAFRCLYLECPAAVVDNLKRRFDEYLAEVLAAAERPAPAHVEQGWSGAEMLDRIVASLREYPNGGGDISVMTEVERIVREAQAERQVAGALACPRCGVRSLINTSHGPYCVSATCKWGWETEMDGSPLKPPLPAERVSAEELAKLIQQWRAYAKSLVVNYPPNDQCADTARIFNQCAAELEAALPPTHTPESGAFNGPCIYPDRGCPCGKCSQ